MRHPGRKLFQTHSPVFLLLLSIQVTIPAVENSESFWGWERGWIRARQEGARKAFSSPSLGLALWDGLGCTFSALSTCSVVNGAVSPGTGRARGVHLVLAPVVREETGGLAQEGRGSTSTRRSLAQQAGRCQVPTQLARCPLKPRTHHVIPLLKTSL